MTPVFAKTLCRWYSTGARAHEQAAVSALSSLAADLAEDAGLTLIGFLRGSSMNVHAGVYRLSQRERSRTPA